MYGVPTRFSGSKTGALADPLSTIQPVFAVAMEPLGRGGAASFPNINVVVPAESGLVCRVRNRHAVGARSTDSTIHVGLGVTQVAEFSLGHGRSVHTVAKLGPRLPNAGALAASFGVDMFL